MKNPHFLNAVVTVLPSEQEFDGQVQFQKEKSYLPMKSEKRVVAIISLRFGEYVDDTA